jgi:hypothetical protein
MRRSTTWIGLAVDAAAGAEDFAVETGVDGPLEATLTPTTVSSSTNFFFFLKDMPFAMLLIMLFFFFLVELVATEDSPEAIVDGSLLT